MATTAEDWKKKGNNAFYNQNDLAITYYSNAIDLDQGNHVLYSNRSAAYAKNSKWQESLNDVWKLIDINPGFVKGYIQAATVYAELGRNNEAYKTAKAGLKEHPSDPTLQEAFNKWIGKQKDTQKKHPLSQMEEMFPIWSPLLKIPLFHYDSNKRHMQRPQKTRLLPMQLTMYHIR